MAKPLARRPISRKPVSKLEELLAFQVRAAGLPAPEREVRLVPGRLYRWDFVWHGRRLAVEVQGATWVKGAHSSGRGIARDCEKAALAAIAGFRSFPVTGEQVRSGEAVRWIERALTG